MATEIVALTREHLPALRRFAEKVWRRPRSEAFYRWRYQDPGFHVAFLALRDGECLAMECAIRRPYRVGDDIVEFLEVFDWFALPELRNAGLGVRVMQRFMQEPHPLLVVGGTPETQGLLPRLKWQVPVRAERWVLPLGAERLASGLASRLGVPAPVARVAARAALLRPGRRPRRRGAAGGEVIPVALPGPELDALYRGDTGYGLVPMWTKEILAWLVGGFAGVGHFVPFYFAREGALRGWALLRVHPTPEGRDAEIVELFAPRPDVELYTWMVSEVACVAGAFEPGRLGACTSCPILIEALRCNRFARTSVNPVQVWRPGWKPGDEPLPEPMLIGSNTGDTSIVPLPERWWDDPPGGGPDDGTA